MFINNNNLSWLSSQVSETFIYYSKTVTFVCICKIITLKIHNNEISLRRLFINLKELSEIIKAKEQ